MAKEVEREAERVRIIFDTDALVRKAVRRRVHKLSLDREEEVTVSEVLTEILRREFSRELEEIRRLERKRESDASE